MTSLINM